MAKALSEMYVRYVVEKNKLLNWTSAPNATDPISQIQNHGLLDKIADSIEKRSSSVIQDFVQENRRVFFTNLADLIPGENTGKEADSDGKPGKYISRLRCVISP